MSMRRGASIARGLRPKAKTVLDLRGQRRRAEGGGVEDAAADPRKRAARDAEERAAREKAEAAAVAARKAAEEEAEARRIAEEAAAAEAARRAAEQEAAAAEEAARKAAVVEAARQRRIQKERRRRLDDRTFRSLTGGALGATDSGTSRCAHPTITSTATRARSPPPPPCQLPLHLFAWLRERLAFRAVTIVPNLPKRGGGNSGGNSGGRGGGVSAGKGAARIARIAVICGAEGGEQLAEGKFVRQLCGHYAPRRMADGVTQEYGLHRRRLDELRELQRREPLALHATPPYHLTALHQRLPPLHTSPSPSPGRGGRAGVEVASLSSSSPSPSRRLRRKSDDTVPAGGSGRSASRFAGPAGDGVPGASPISDLRTRVEHWTAVARLCTELHGGSNLINDDEVGGIVIAAAAGPEVDEGAPGTHRGRHRAELVAACQTQVSVHRALRHAGSLDVALEELDADDLRGLGVTAAELPELRKLSAEAAAHHHDKDGEDTTEDDAALLGATGGATVTARRPPSLPDGAVTVFGCLLHLPLWARVVAVGKEVALVVEFLGRLHRLVRPTETRPLQGLRALNHPSAPSDDDDDDVRRQRQRKGRGKTNDGSRVRASRASPPPPTAAAPTAPYFRHSAWMELVGEERRHQQQRKEEDALRHQRERENTKKEQEEGAAEAEAHSRDVRRMLSLGSAMALSRASPTDTTARQGCGGGGVEERECDSDCGSDEAGASGSGAFQGIAMAQSLLSFSNSRPIHDHGGSGTGGDEGAAVAAPRAAASDATTLTTPRGALTCLELLAEAARAERARAAECELGRPQSRSASDEAAAAASATAQEATVAATIIQAHERGRRARRSVAARRTEAESAAPTAAVMLLQGAGRGAVVRRALSRTKAVCVKQQQQQQRSEFTGEPIDGTFITTRKE